MSTQGTCPICCNQYTPKLRKSVECFACSGKACVPCVKAYLVNSMNDPHCMHCKIAWNRQFIDNHICKSFMLKEYKEHRENILCEREKSKLPETQALYTTVQERQNLLYADIEQMQDQRKVMNREFKAIRQDYEERCRILDDAIHQRTRHFSVLDQVLSGRTNNLPNDADFFTEVANKTREFIHPCPVADCKGMLSQKYKCGICSTYVCKDCHCVIEKLNDPNHTCKEDDVATVKQIKKETRSCPSCAVPIFKIDGCDQMWCTQCHKAFSWKTGQVVSRGQIHNPHFYEWKRNNGGLAAGAVDADGCPVALPDIATINAKWRTLVMANPRTRRSPWVLNDIHREIGHVRAIELADQREMVDPTRRLRILYLTQKISEKEWKTNLQKMEKQENIHRETSQLFDMYVDATRDIFIKIVNSSDAKSILDCLKEFASLGTYVQQSLRMITTRYNIQKLYPYLFWMDDLKQLISTLDGQFGSTSTSSTS